MFYNNVMVEWPVCLIATLRVIRLNLGGMFYQIFISVGEWN